MSIKRRTLLEGTLAGGALAAAAGAGLLAPRLALAEWPKVAFQAKSVTDALAGLLEGQSPASSDQITITAPEIAENGVVVPVTVETSLQNVQSISIFAAGNPTPLAAHLELLPGTAPFIATRIKMAKTAEVVAVVKTTDGAFIASREVKVTVGGCGG